MLVIVVITCLITIIMLIITSIFYILSSINDESDDNETSNSLGSNYFTSTPSVSPVGLDQSPMCNNPNHHHHYEETHHDVKSSTPSEVSGAALGVKEDVGSQANQSTADNVDTSHNSNAVDDREDILSETDVQSSSEGSSSLSGLIGARIVPSVWTGPANEQKNTIMSQLGAPASKQLFEDFDSKEMQLGGTGLHWCKTRKSLEKLIKLGLPLDLLNSRHETALHVAVRKRKLQILIGLLCHGADVNVQNQHGEIPLILAGKVNDIFATQLLLVFDSKVNAVDHLGLSARHYVSSICDRHKNQAQQPQLPSAAHLILAMLNEMGAKRCSEPPPCDVVASVGGTSNQGSNKQTTIDHNNNQQKVNLHPALPPPCTDGCSHSGTYNGNSYNRWPNSNKESLYKRHMFSDLVKIIKSQKSTEIAMRHQHHESNSGQYNGAATGATQQHSEQMRGSRLLCIDGGGMRGIIVCQIMIEMEKYLKRPMMSYFDWIGGTSAGAFLSCALCTGNSLFDLRRICFDVKDEVFSGNKPYNSKFLERVLKRTYGASTRMSFVRDKKLAVTTVIADRDPCQLRMFRNYLEPAKVLESYGYSPELYVNMSGHSTITRTAPRENKNNELSNNDHLVDENETDPFIWQAVRASGAAPFFFKPYGPYLDGGIISNNPTLDMLTEFHSYESAKSFLRSRENINSSDESAEGRQKQKKHHHNNRLLGSSNLHLEPPSRLELVVSLGTGRGRVVGRQAMIDFGNVASGLATVFSPVELLKSIRATRDLFKKLMQQSCQTEDHILDRAQAWCSSLGIPYFRINPPLATIFSIDDKRDEQLINALWQTKLYMRIMRPQLEELSIILDGESKPKNNDEN